MVAMGYRIRPLVAMGYRIRPMVAKRGQDRTSGC